MQGVNAPLTRQRKQKHDKRQVVESCSRAPPRSAPHPAQGKIITQNKRQQRMPQQTFLTPHTLKTNNTDPQTTEASTHPAARSPRTCCSLESPAASSARAGTTMADKHPHQPLPCRPQAWLLGMRRIPGHPCRPQQHHVGVAPPWRLQRKPPRRGQWRLDHLHHSALSLLVVCGHQPPPLTPDGGVPFPLQPRTEALTALVRSVPADASLPAVFSHCATA